MKILFLLVFSIAIGFASEYKYRKYEHIKDFLKPLIEPTVKLGLKYNVPPSAILAIACVESGYGRGYVASISGNIMSLGANKGEKDLPTLYLPNTKEPYKIIYNPKEIAKYKKDELIYKKRARSLKKDYRPLYFAGRVNYLHYFDEHSKEKLKANLACIKDFCIKWISYQNKFEPFKKAREDLDNSVKKYGKDTLFCEKTVTKFIYNIGGKKNSFNYRKSWPKKVITVIQNIGLIQLTIDIRDKKDFDKVWVN
jgi:hypothetical protein